MDKRNFLEVDRYDTCTFNFFLVFWDTLIAPVLSRGNPLGSGGQAYWLVACTRQVTSAS